MILYICKKQPATWFEDTGHLIQSLPAIPSIAQVMNHPVRNHHIERIVIKGQLACVASIDRDALSYSLSAGIGQGSFWTISRLVLLQPEVDTYGTSEWDATCCSSE